MKKLMIMLALVLVLSFTAVCFAEETPAVDTAGWQRRSFEGSAVSMLLPPDFGLDEDEEMPEDSFYYASNGSCAVDVYEYEGNGSTNEEIVEELGELEYIETAQIITVSGKEIVGFEGADDNVFGYIVVSPEGTVYEFNFYPFFEAEDGVAVAQAIAGSIEIAD